MNSKTVQLLRKELVTKKNNLHSLHIQNNQIQLDTEESAKDVVDRSDVEESWFAKERLSQHWKLELAYIDVALQKMEQGTFGICEECGEAIPVKRLRVRPDAAYCLICQETVERESAQMQRQNLMPRKSSGILKTKTGSRSSAGSTTLLQ